MYPDHNPQASQAVRSVRVRCSARIRSRISAIGPSIPTRIRVHIAGVLDLAHGGAAAANSTAKVGAAATAVHEVDDEGGDEGGPAKPQEGAGRLRLTAILLRVGRAVADAVGGCVCLGLLAVMVHVIQSGVTYSV
jgi:hypothetical protein